MDDDLTKPPGRRELADLLEIALERERWQAIRSALAEWLVWIGIPLWATAARPGLLPAGVDRLVVGLWAAVCAIFVYAAAREWGWRRKA